MSLLLFVLFLQTKVYRATALHTRQIQGGSYVELGLDNPLVDECSQHLEAFERGALLFVAAQGLRAAILDRRLERPAVEQLFLRLGYKIVHAMSTRMRNGGDPPLSRDLCVRCAASDARVLLTELGLHDDIKALATFLGICSTAQLDSPEPTLLSVAGGQVAYFVRESPLAEEPAV